MALPTEDEVKTPTGRRPHNFADAKDKQTRQKWRALALAIKAKLELVESGITSFETEFLAHIILPDGRTMGQWAIPQIEAAYQNRTMPQLLPGLPGAEEGQIDDQP